MTAAGPPAPPTPARPPLPHQPQHQPLHIAAGGHFALLERPVLRLVARMGGDDAALHLGADLPAVRIVGHHQPAGLGDDVVDHAPHQRAMDMLMGGDAGDEGGPFGLRSAVERGARAGQAVGDRQERADFGQPAGGAVRHIVAAPQELIFGKRDGALETDDRAVLADRPVERHAGRPVDGVVDGSLGGGPVERAGGQCRQGERDQGEGSPARRGGDGRGGRHRLGFSVRPTVISSSVFLRK